MTTEETERESKQKESLKRNGGKMTVEEAGRRGGERTAETRGHEFYQAIGKKGGEAVSRDRQHMAQIGRKGGEAVSRNRAHMAQIGQKGGEARSRAFKRQQLENKAAADLKGATLTSREHELKSEQKEGKLKGGQEEKAG
ncbi:MAG: hypothetical protein RJB13_1491 [Pseudomonadota bacterium]